MTLPCAYPCVQCVLAQQMTVTNFPTVVTRTMTMIRTRTSSLTCYQSFQRPRNSSPQIKRTSWKHRKHHPGQLLLPIYHRTPLHHHRPLPAPQDHQGHLHHRYSAKKRMTTLSISFFFPNFSFAFCQQHVFVIYHVCD